MNPIAIEVCINSVDSAIAAQEGGAQRVELCDNLYEGGTTPSAGCVELTRQRITIGLHVIIRPRGADFCYSPLEFEIMKRDIAIVKDLGADGIVFGILKSDGAVDVERSQEIVELARPMSVTFHRAFDMTPDPIQALNDIIPLGVDRILTSGQANKAIDGAGCIADLVAEANGRTIIMPVVALTKRISTRFFGKPARRNFTSLGGNPSKAS